MAVQTLKVVICDKCGRDEPTSRWTITFPTGKRRTLDLCDGCAEPLVELSELVVVEGRGPKGHGQPVLSMDEVETRVRRARRKPSSRART